jgi:hypothetical protein
MTPSTHSLTARSNIPGSLWIGPCLLNNLNLTHDAASVLYIYIFDLDRTPVKGDVPIRAYSLIVGAVTDFSFIGGIPLYRGLAIGVAQSPSAFFAYDPLLYSFQNVYVQASIAVPPPPPMPEKLPTKADTAVIEAPIPSEKIIVPSVAAARPPNTSRPAPQK